MSSRQKIYAYSVVIIGLFSLTACNSSLSVSNPEIVNIEDSTVTIAWASERPNRGQIHYYAAGNRDMAKTAEENFSHSYRHEVIIDGLETGTQYIYWIGDTETKYFFRTKPAGVKPFSFLIELDPQADRTASLLMTEMPEFILSFSKGSDSQSYQSIKAYVPVYDLYGQKSAYLNAANRNEGAKKAWQLDWGGLNLCFVEDASQLDQLLDSPIAHTIGVIVRDNSQALTERAIRDSALHERIIDHNKRFASNKIAFVLMPGASIVKNEIDAINYLQLPLVETSISKRTAAVRIDVGIEASYAVLLDTQDEFILKSPPLKENRTCEECRRLASTGSYRESVLAYQEFIKNNQGHFQIDDAYYAIADIMDTKLFQFEAALIWYNKLLSDYPDSTLTPLAAQRLEYIAKYADHNFLPLSRFEQIRKVEWLQIKNSVSGHAPSDKDKILDKAQSIVAQYPDAAIAPVIYYWLANQYRSQNIAKARKMYLTLSEKYPDHPHSKDVWWEIGEAYYDAGEYTEAIAAFSEALVMIPASAEDLEAQIARAKRNLRRRHLNLICMLIAVVILLLGIFMPPAGIQFSALFKAVPPFVALWFIFLGAGWLIAEQFSSGMELVKIAAGTAAAFTWGFPFTHRLSYKILRVSKCTPDHLTAFAALIGIMLSLIFAVTIIYLTIYHTNQHFLTILKL